MYTALCIRTTSVVYENTGRKVVTTKDGRRCHRTPALGLYEAIAEVELGTTQLLSDGVPGLDIAGHADKCMNWY